MTTTEFEGIVVGDKFIPRISYSKSGTMTLRLQETDNNPFVVQYNGNHPWKAWRAGDFEIIESHTTLPDAPGSCIGNWTKCDACAMCNIAGRCKTEPCRH